MVVCHNTKAVYNHFVLQQFTFLQVTYYIFKLHKSIAINRSYQSLFVQKMSHKSYPSTGEGEEKLWKDFQQAIRKGDENQVTRILLESSGRRTLHPFLTKKIATTEGRLTALHLAVKHGKESIVKLLLEKGINVNDVNEPHKCTALHMALDQLDDNIGIIQLLLGHKCINVNVTDEYGHTPIKLAAEKGNREAVKMLLDKGADITKADSVDNTAIHVAADKGHHEVLQLLLPKVAAQHPGIIGSLNKDRNTPLHLAVRKQCKNTVALLICYGAATSLNVENQHNETPKQLAAGNKGIIDLLDNPSKAQQQVQELFRPVNKVVKEIGRGGSVEADTGHPVSEHTPQATSSTLVTGLQEAAGCLHVQPMVLIVTAQHMKVNNEFKTEVRDGGLAAIGPGSEVNVGGSTVTSSVHPQSPPAVESSYQINVSGGSASIGDHSVTNVGTVMPRTPSTAGTIEDPFIFPEQPENRDNTRPGCSTENESVGELTHSVPEETSSGNPTESENGSDTPGNLSHAVPEVGSAASSTKKAVLSYPVPERNNAGTPMENASDADAPGKLPYPVPEESRTQKAEAPINSLSSARNGVLVAEAGPRGDSTNTKSKVTRGPSKGTKTRETVTNSRNTTPTSTAGSVNSSSSGRVVASSGDAGVRTTEGGKTACGDEMKRSNASPGNNKNVQAIGSSANVGAPKASAVDVAPSKNNTGWESALQKNRKSEDSRRAGPLTRAVPKDLSKRLLQMSNTPGRDPTVADILQSQRPDLDPASEVRTVNRPLEEFQQLPGGTESKSKGTVCQPPGAAKKEEKQGDERSDRLNRVGQFGSPGPPSRVSADDLKSVAPSNAGASGKASESATTSRMGSSSKETPHRKETFLRDDSFPDSDQQMQMAANTSTRTVTVADDETVYNAGVSGDSDTQPPADVNSPVMDVIESENAHLLQNVNPEDDVGGMKRCDSHECAIM